MFLGVQFFLTFHFVFIQIVEFEAYINEILDYKIQNLSKWNKSHPIMYFISSTNSLSK